MPIIDIDKIMNRATVAWSETVDMVDPAMKAAIQLKVYKWPRITARRNGTMVGSPRDIVDSRDLLEKQGIRKLGASHAVIYNLAPHAMVNHEGMDNRPPRRWTRKAIRGTSQASPNWQDPEAILNIPEAFKNAFNRTA
jgi:hypothetical protein